MRAFDVAHIPMEYTPNEVWDVLDENGNKTACLLNVAEKWGVRC